MSPTRGSEVVRACELIHRGTVGSLGERCCCGVDVLLEVLSGPGLPHSSVVFRKPIGHRVGSSIDCIVVRVCILLEMVLDLELLGLQRQVNRAVLAHPLRTVACMVGLPVARLFPRLLPWLLRYLRRQ